MDIILFGQDQGEQVNGLEIFILRHLSDVQMRRISTFQQLSGTFSRPMNQTDVLVFFASYPQENRDLLSLKPMLSNTRLILVLLSRSKGMLESAFELTPSFISYYDSDPMDIVSVLKKISQKRDNNPADIENGLLPGEMNSRKENFYLMKKN